MRKEEESSSSYPLLHVQTQLVQKAGEGEVE